MSYKAYIYAVTLVASAFALSGINFTNLFKTNHKVEAKLLIMLIAMSLSYLVSSFIISFIEATSLA